MNYNVLYRKWRPKNFKNVIGQDIIVKYIINSFLNNKIHHSYIFSGDRGTGKTTIARLFAKLINCLNINFKNNNIICESCKNCLLIDNNSFIDLIEIDAASKTKVEEIKDIIESIKYPPIYSKYKIYIIDEIHMLSKHSFASLLKIIEEPPCYLKFILATTDINKIPLTIISRCIHLNFNKISNENIKKNLIYILNKENIYFDNYSLDLVSRFSYGSMRDALNIIEQLIVIGNNKILNNNIYKIFGICNIKILFNILKYLIKKNIKNILKILNCLNNINYINLLDDIIIIFYNILMIKINNNFLIDEYFNKIIFNIKDNVDINTIYKFFNILTKEKKNIILYPNLKIGFELIIIKIIYNI